MILLLILTLCVVALRRLARTTNPLSYLDFDVRVANQDFYQRSSARRPRNPPSSKREAQSPMRWLKENSSPLDEPLPHRTLAPSSRPKAALISLVRNEELEGILQSMRQLEFHWNRKYQYPWIFFNERPFSEEFIVSRRTSHLCINPTAFLRHP